MSQVIDQATDAIKGRLDEIKDEQTRLERALTSLNGTGARRGRPGGMRSSTGGARRAKRGERERQLLSSIQRKPNYKAADHARELKVAPAQVYSLIKKLTTDGKIKKLGNGFTIKEA